MAVENMDLAGDRRNEILIVAWVMTGAAFLTVVFKLFTRLQVVEMTGWDDFWIVFSLILSISASSFVHYGVHLGFGRHTAVVIAEYGAKHMAVVAKFQILGYPFNIGAFSFPNLAITILICQLLNLNKLRCRLLYGMTILQITFAMITVVLAFAQCTPTEKLWFRTMPGKCWNPKILNNFSYWLCAYTTFTDVVLALVPVFAFWKLQMKRSTKIGLCVLMSMTMLSAIVTIIKGTYLPLFTDEIDPLPLVLWGLVEQNIVIMAACVPTLRPLFHKSWSRPKSGPGFSGSGSDDTSGSRRKAWQRGSHQRALSPTKGSVHVDYIGHKEFADQRDYAASAESQQGIMLAAVVHGPDDDWPISRTDEIVSKNSKEVVTNNVRYVSSHGL